MLQTANHTPFATGLALFPDEEGIDTVYPIIKASFSVSDTIALAEKQQPLKYADEYNGEPGASSIKYAAEACPLKPATDVVLIGNAYSPNQHPCAEVDVTLRIGAKEKAVRVFGDRKWKNGAFGVVATKPEEFTEMPLLYERAYGGMDTTKSGQEVGCDFNTAGRGYFHPKSERDAVGTLLPNLEDPRDPIKRYTSNPKPACFAPVSPNWHPRLPYAGTYDERWQKTRAPYLPSDFDLRFFSVAPADLIFSPYLEGGETIEITNATRSGQLRFHLPRIRFDVTLRIAGKSEKTQVYLETVLIEPDANLLSMVWKGKRRCDKQLLKMELATFDIAQSDKHVKGL